MNKKGYFFSVDALIGLVVIIGVIFLIRPEISNVSYDVQIHDDLLRVLSDLDIGEINNTYVHALIANGSVENLNFSVLEQIGEFYSSADSKAHNLAQNIIDSLDIKQDVALFFDDVLIANSSYVNFSDAGRIKTSRQMISGIGGGVNASSGFSSRAFLYSENKIKYFYFGGYVGDGNITMNIGENVSSVSIEGDFSNDFDLFINDVFVGDHNVTSGIPYSIDLSSYSFESGQNNISFRSENLLSVGGGYTRVVYNDSHFEDNIKYLPGITGLINLYDGFFVPGNLTDLEIFLHYSSPYDIFMNIGDEEVYFGKSGVNATSITINDATLSGLLDYDFLSENTVPLRIGVADVSDIVSEVKKADVYSVTDLSGSMSWGTPSRISQAIPANRVLVDVILEYSDNRVGLVGYETTASEEWFHELSKDEDSLNAKLDTYVADGGTCICCGINKAVSAFISEPLSTNDGVNSVEVQSRVSQTSDDSEERSDGYMESLSSSDLELVEESSTQQVGMRFLDIDIPQGATIGSAYIEFEADETDSTTTHLSFSAEDVDDSVTFTSDRYSVSSRVKTSSIVTWSNVPSWSTTSEKHQTPDLSSVIQEVVDRGGWVSGNSIAIIVNGSGKRVAESYNGEANNAPLLVVEYFLWSVTCGDGVIDLLEECDDANVNNNDNCTNMCTYPVCGDGSIWDEEGGLETCDDGGFCSGDNVTNCFLDSECALVGGTCEPAVYDGCDDFCQIEERYDAIMVMSDGSATRECAEQGVTADLNGNGNADDAGDDAIQAACDAYNNYGITVYSVGFGDGADEATLQDIASCGQGDYHFGDVDDLIDIYRQIAEDILNAVYEEQTLVGDGSLMTLFSDSKISFGYDEKALSYGMEVVLESAEFGNTISEGSFFVPDDSVAYEVGVVSYSGSKWTALVEVYNNGSGLWESVFNLSEYSDDYTTLGDPYVFNIPIDKITSGENRIRVNQGVDPTNISGGSIYDKIIYTLIRDIAAYSSVLPVANGCIWHIEFEDGSNDTMLFPSNYLGTDNCYFAEDDYFFFGNNVVLENSQDAISNAVLNLLNVLDLNSNNKIEVKFGETDMDLSSVEIEGLPFTWSTEVQARTWR
jgi:cysteine-rich repeat protein